MRRTAPRWILRITRAEAVVLRRLRRLWTIPTLINLFRLFTRLGDGPLWVMTGVVLPLVKGEEGLWAAGAMAASLALASGLFKLVKGSIGRRRPAERWEGMEALLAPPDRFSFPSGHSMTSFAAATTLALMVPGSGSLFYPLAVLIALSRVFLGLHYPTDVLAGSLLGIGVGWGVVKELLPLVR